ncbi:MAG TPA: glutamate racemase [Roseiarcus sp.]|nr:glutamate racemase [Roseiarcus sp.]
MKAVGAPRSARVLIFDSGLGGLTVLAGIARRRPDAELIYAADDAFFPYGALDEAALVARVGSVMASLIERHAPDLAVIACNTASTLVLPPLRAAFPDLPFVGTVPAIKPAAEASLTRLVSVLATPGTVARDYTRALVRDFAGDCEVTLVGSARLAGLAELFLRGEAIDDAEVAREIAPCFVDRGGRRTDQVVLACTHFPLLMEHFVRLAPWPVEFVDPAPAIARRVDALLGEPSAPRDPRAIAPAIFTSGRPPSIELQKALRRRGLAATSAGVRAAAI